MSDVRCQMSDVRCQMLEARCLCFNLNLSFVSRLRVKVQG